MKDEVKCRSDVSDGSEGERRGAQAADPEWGAVGTRTQGFPGLFSRFWLGDPPDGAAVPDKGNGWRKRVRRKSVVFDFGVDGESS